MTVTPPSLSFSLSHSLSVTHSLTHLASCVRNAVMIMCIQVPHLPSFSFFYKSVMMGARWRMLRPFIGTGGVSWSVDRWWVGYWWKYYGLMTRDRLMHCVKFSLLIYIYIDWLHTTFQEVNDVPACTLTYVSFGCVHYNVVCLCVYILMCKSG